MRASPRVFVLAAVALLVVLAVGVAVHLAAPEDGPADLTVGWGGSEGIPSCLYRPDSATVDVRLVVDGEAPRPTEVTVTVTAYADENTSRPVGSVTRTVEVEGTVHESLGLAIPVERAPHVDADQEAACRLAFDH